MILAGLMGSLAASGGVTKTITQSSIAYNTLQEGQQQTITVQTEHWDNSTVYWRITNQAGTELTSQLDQSSGSFSGGYSTNSHSINFTFNADATTEGSLSYYVHFSSDPGGNDMLLIGPQTCRDSSQTNALVLDLDPANWDVDWYDSSGQSNDASMNNLTDSGDNGGVFVFNGTSSYANVPTLTNSIYGSVTVSAWIKPSAVNVTQTIISKEICYKMIITSDGRIAWMVGDASGNSWTTTIYAAAGLVTAGAWAHVLATVDADATKIYVNGVLASTGDGEILIANSYRFAIGAYDVGQAGFGDFFGGRFGEVKMWNYALTETVVIGQYNTTAARYGRSVIPLSLNFPTSGNNYVTVQNIQNDWSLGSTYTFEFWSKSIRSSNTIQTVMSQGDGYNNIDIGYQEGKLLFANAKWTAIPEPTPGGQATGAYNIGSPGGWNGVGTPGSWQNLATTGGTGTGLTINVAGAQGGYANAISIVNPGSGYTEGDSITATGESSVSFNINVSAAVWTHVALVRNGTGSGNPVTVYYNGVSQGTFVPGALTNVSNDLILGRRGSGTFQYFKGNLALIRISNTAKYLTNFDPSFSYGVEADTKLMLGYDPSVDTSTLELNGLSASANGGLRIYFAKSTYPDLNNQVQVGYTVVSGNDPTTSVVTGAVYTADPDNWGVPVSPGWPSLPGAVNFSGPGRHPISLQGAVSTSTEFPAFLSLEFNNPQQDYLSTPASADWNLGNNWTIEFWIRSNNNSASNINIPGGQWGLINQGGWYYGMPDDNCILVGMSGGYLSIGQSATGDISFAEPTTRVWTHVAIVNNGGGSAQKVYYNGVEQTPTGANYTTNGKTNTTETLYIGRLEPSYGGYFDGKMAMIRISNTAKYLTTFSATTTYGVEADTKLFLSKLNPLVDSMSHTITNNGVTTSNSFPS